MRWAPPRWPSCHPFLVACSSRQWSLESASRAFTSAPGYVGQLRVALHMRGCGDELERASRCRNPEYPHFSVTASVQLGQSSRRLACRTAVHWVRMQLNFSNLAQILSATASARGSGLLAPRPYCELQVGLECFLPNCTIHRSVIEFASILTRDYQE